MQSLASREYTLGRLAARLSLARDSLARCSSSLRLRDAPRTQALLPTEAGLILSAAVIILHIKINGRDADKSIISIRQRAIYGARLVIWLADGRPFFASPARNLKGEGNRSASGQRETREPYRDSSLVRCASATRRRPSRQWLPSRLDSTGPRRVDSRNATGIHFSELRRLTSARRVSRVLENAKR